MASMGFDIFARDHASKTFDQVGDKAERLGRRLDGVGKSGTSLRGDLDGLGGSVSGLSGHLSTLSGHVSGAASSLLSAATGVATSVVQFGAMAGAAASAASGVSGLVVALAPAAGALAALPGAIGLGAAAMATFKVALSGVSDGFSAALGDDPKKYAEALETLSPAARSVTEELHGLKPAFDGLKNSVQDAMFAPLQGQLTALSNTLSGPLREGMSGVAGEFGAIGARLAEFARSADSVRAVHTIFADLKKAVAGVAPGLAPMLAGFRDIATVGSGFLAGLAPGIGAAATRLGDFLTRAADSGKALEWMNNALLVFKQLGSIAADAGGILKSVFTAIQTAGGGALGVIGQLLDKVNAFLKSGEGQDTLVTIFKALNDVGSAFMPIIVALGGAVAAIAPQVAKLAQALGPVLAEAVTALGPAIAAMGPGLIKMVEGIGKAVEGLAPLLKPLGTELGKVFAELGGALALILPQIGKIAVALGPALASAVKALGPALAALGPGLIAVAENLAKAFASPEMQRGLLALGKGISDVLIAAAPLLPVIAQLAGLLVQLLGGALSNLGVLLAPIIKALGTALEPALRAISDALNLLMPLMPPIYKAFGEIGAALITQLLPPVLNLIPALINNLIPAFAEFARQIEPLIPLLADLAVKFINDVLPSILPVLPELTNLAVQLSKVGIVLAQLVVDVAPQIERLIAAFQHLYDTLVGHSIIPDLIEGIRKWFQQGVDWVAGIVAWFGQLPGMFSAWLGSVVNWVQEKWSLIKDYIAMKINEIETTISTVLDSIKTMWNNIWAAVATFVSGKIDDIKAFIGKLGEIPGQVSNWFGQVKDGIANKFNEAVTFVQGIPQRMKDALGNLGNLLWDSGRSMVQGLINGISSMISNAVSTVTNLLNEIRSRLPFSPAKEGPFSGKGWTLYSGMSMAQGLADGLAKGQGMVAKAAAGVMGAASMSLTPSFSGGGAGAVPLTPQGGAPTFVFNFAGQPLIGRDEITRVVVAALNEAKGRGFNLGFAK